MIGFSKSSSSYMLSTAVASCICLAACGGAEEPATGGETIQSAPNMTASAALSRAEAAAPMIEIRQRGSVTPDGLVDFAGKAFSRQDLIQVTWANSLGGSGSATLFGDSRLATWTAQRVPLEPGENTVTFTVLDQSGNKSSAQFNVSYVAPPPKAMPLPSLPVPAWNQVSGTPAGSWDGVSPLLDTSTGTPLLERVLDPNGSGRSVHLRRILKSGPLIASGIRAENTWASVDYGLQPGTDYWMAFAVMIKADEAIPSTDSGLLVFQTHTAAPGSTNPDIALVMQGARNQMRWHVAYNTYPSDSWKTTGGPNPDTEALTTVSTQALPTPGRWTRFIIHYRPGYLTSHNPLFEVWQASEGVNYVKLFTYTGFNTYNSLSGPSYPRIGPYRWSGSEWSVESMAFYQTQLFFARGVNLFDSAASALAGL